MNIDLKYPTCWDQVTREHLLIMGKLLTKDLTREDLLFDMLCKITGIRPLMEPGMDEDTPEAEYLFTMKGKGKFWMPVWMIRQACEELSFMVETIGLPECPILSVNSKIHGVSFKQYYFADAYLVRYHTTKDKQMILNFYKALTGKKIRALEQKEINAISIWWTGLKDHFKKTYPEVFREGEAEIEKTPADILQEILSILNQNNPGRNEEILSSDVHAVMHALNNIYTIAKKYDNK